MFRFKLTNGTDSVNFLATGKSGTLIQSWEPAYAVYKGGGVTAESPIEDGRRLILKRWEWPVESIDFAIRFSEQDQVISELRSIEALAQQAINFWDRSHYEIDPVWVEVRADGETSSRYALVLEGTVVRLPNPFAQPWGMATGRASTGIMTFNFIRTHWQDQIPGQVSSPVVKQETTYNTSPAGDINQYTYESGVTFTQNWVYVSNHLNENSNIDTVMLNGGGNVYATLTDYFATWSVGDYIEFQSDAAYGGVVLDVGNPASTALGLAFEYWDGGAWTAAFNVEDTTSGLTQAGYIQFNTDTDWDTTNFPFRIRLTATNGVASSPGRRSSAFREFAPAANYATISSDALSGRTAGDIEDLLKLSIRMEASAGEYIDRLIVGCRSESRGSSFRSYITLYQTAPWYFITTTLWPTNTYVSWVTTYGSAAVPLALMTDGDGIKHDAPTPGTYITEDAAEIAFSLAMDTAYAPQYRGSYRMLVRCLVGNSDDYHLWRFRGYVDTGSGAVWTQTGKIADGAPTSTSAPMETQYIDLGVVSMYGTKTASIGVTSAIGMGIKAWNTPEAADTVTYTVPDITFLSFVLIPVDEAYIELAPHNWTDRDVALVADSATNPSSTIETYVESVQGWNLGPLSALTANELSVETGSDVGVHFFYSSRTQDPADVNFSKYSNLLKILGVNVEYVKRYLSFR